MKIGTKSLLFGAHQFLLHPICVLLAWWRLYGFPLDPRIWIAALIHDWGYWGSPNIDGERGKQHPQWAAFVMWHLFGYKWYEFCLYHSRYWAKRHDRPMSKLCVADKLAFCFAPKWLYLPLIRLTGEIEEFLGNTPEIVTRDPDEWYDFIYECSKKWETRKADMNYGR
jgi:hypothetical protein